MLDGDDGIVVFDRFLLFDLFSLVMNCLMKLTKNMIELSVQEEDLVVAEKYERFSRDVRRLLMLSFSIVA